MFEFWSLDNSSSKSILDIVGDDLFEISEAHSTENYNSQVWSVQGKWQLFLRSEGQGRDGYSGEHERDGNRI